MRYDHYIWVVRRQRVNMFFISCSSERVGEVRNAANGRVCNTVKLILHDSDCKVTSSGLWRRVKRQKFTRNLLSSFSEMSILNYDIYLPGCTPKIRQYSRNNTAQKFFFQN
jgi:hypothetical protein